MNFQSKSHGLALRSFHVEIPSQFVMKIERIAGKFQLQYDFSEDTVRWPDTYLGIYI
jgi:hypothetical protein